MSDYASANGNTLRIARRLPGPIERAWAYVVESEKRALWFAGGEWDLRVGGQALVVFDHTRVSDEPVPEAWQPMEGVASAGTITRIDPPRLVAYRFAMGDTEFEVTFELTAEGADVILVITQAPVADSQGQAAFASGWHAYLDVLEDRLRGVEPRAFWTNFDRLQAEYAGRF